MKLHLGCGSRNFGPDWIHIDGDDQPHLHSHDIINLPFEDNTIDLIYCAHTIEYFDREEIVEVLKEWHRVMKFGATLRLAVPDFEVMTRLYQDGKCSLSDITGPIFGIWKMGNQIIQHKTTYDYKELKLVLRQNGFKGIHRYDWRLTEHSKFDDHSRAHLPHDKEAMRTGNFTDKHTLISLNVEAIK